MMADRALYFFITSPFFGNERRKGRIFFSLVLKPKVIAQVGFLSFLHLREVFSVLA